MTSFNSGTDRNLQLRRRLALAVCVIAIGSIWCGVLPWLSSQQHIQKRLQFLDDRGIDPSAMFYTELEAMDPILDRIEGRTHAHRGSTNLSEN